MHNDENRRVDSLTMIIAVVPKLPNDACLDLNPVFECLEAVVDRVEHGTRTPVNHALYMIEMPRSRCSVLMVMSLKT